MYTVMIERFVGFTRERKARTITLGSPTSAYSLFDREATKALMEDMDAYRVELSLEGSTLREIRFEDRKCAREPCEGIMTAVIVPCYDCEGNDKVKELFNAIHRAEQAARKSNRQVLIQLDSGALLTIPEARHHVTMVQMTLDMGFMV